MAPKGVFTSLKDSRKKLNNIKDILKEDHNIPNSLIMELNTIVNDLEDYVMNIRKFEDSVKSITN